MKPKSWCIDIRQEHPLLDKFKEWYQDVLAMDRLTWSYDYYWYDKASWFFDDRYDWWLIITLDQRRERRGKEYYENNLNN